MIRDARQRRWYVFAFVLASAAILALVFPHPEAGTQVFTERDFPRAVLTAYRVAFSIERPSGVMFNGVTYTFLVRNASPRDIEVVFLPRMIFQRHVFRDAPEEIHVIVRRPEMHVVRWHFSE